MIIERLVQRVLLLIALPALAQTPVDGVSLSTSPVTQEEILEALPTGERWLGHATNDLMPFWTSPAALGNSPGAFPSMRCNDGSLIDDSHPCPEIKNNQRLSGDRQRHLVALSRQTYGYGVLFHLTGDPKFLDAMTAGVDYIRQNAIDRHGGGMFTQQAANNGAWGPERELRPSNEIAYGLLGLSLYYYLTRDETTLADILQIKDYVFATYQEEKLDGLRSVLRSNRGQGYEQRRLVAQLDQMNAYLALLTPILPEPHQTEFKGTLSRLSRILIDQFYSPADNMFANYARTPDYRDISRAGSSDFGLTIKAMWMIRFTGLLTGESHLVRFAEDNGLQVLERAYLDETGSWARAPRKDGQLDIDKIWWIYCELDQFAATLAMSDVGAAKYLPRTYDYWFKHFIDHQHQEVWWAVDGATNQPRQDMPKTWKWKNAYHSLEHALVGYISSQQIHGKPVTLYFAFKHLTPDTVVRPYLFTGKVDGLARRPLGRGGSVYAVTFHDVR